MWLQHFVDIPDHVESTQNSKQLNGKKKQMKCTFQHQNHFLVTLQLEPTNLIRITRYFELKPIFLGFTFCHLLSAISDYIFVSSESSK